jgi:hypothetical protein
MYSARTVPRMPAPAPHGRVAIKVAHLLAYLRHCCCCCWARSLSPPQPAYPVDPHDIIVSLDDSSDDDDVTDTNV